MSSSTVTVAISTVHPGPYGGAVFTGKDLAGRLIRAIADSKSMLRAPLKGEIWELTGKVVWHPKYGDQLHIEQSKLLPPAGRLLLNYLTTHPNFRGIGIGQAKASRLYEKFGDQLPSILDEERIEVLYSVLDKEAAQKLIETWQKTSNESSVIAFLDKHGISTRLARKVLYYWPEQTIKILRENPYRLLLFAEWPTVDRIACSLGVGPADERRLIAAAEAAVYYQLDVAKNTLNDSHVVEKSIKSLLQASDGTIASRSLSLAVADRAIVGDQLSGFQPSGCAVMERYLMSRFDAMVKHQGTQQSLFNNPSDPIIESCINTFEQQEQMTLNAEQRDAVRMATTESLSVLTGSAGVGKTTVLKAIYQVADTLNINVIQMALAGRAAQRMREATGREAFTIIGFLNRVRSKKIRLSPNDLVIIDEASMIDLMLVYRLMRALPMGVRLLLVGDPYQLPPIGPGLIFHIMAASSKVQVKELIQVHRQAESTGIPQIAGLIRDGVAPHLPTFGGTRPGVSFLECRPNSIINLLVDIVSDLGGFRDVQILGVTKRGVAGVMDINRTFYQKLATPNSELKEWGLAEGSLILYTVNDYDRELYNGSLGQIEEVLPTAIRNEEQDGEPIKAVCNFDGRKLGMTEAELVNIDLAYAITTHKAQGSQFKRVVIPITKSRLLDRTLIYTALTRGMEQVVFVGEKQAFDEAVISHPSVANRTVGFAI
ncbi:MAG: exodeoxyribonuclease alpha subunit [Acidobacteriota bacterium]|jgi:exodeoxyribonuclease V alpha subunit|nr:exodeoxyribonuclease alpha subunit [Acidobacteriota bacterium]